MNIGIDLDDTFTNTFESNIGYGQNYEINVLNKNGEIKDVNQFFDQMFEWSKEEFKKYLETYAEEIANSVVLKPFCKEILNKLKEEGHRIIIITARDKEYHRLKDPYQFCEKWLKDNEIYYDKLIVECNDKLKACEENDINLFIDDKFETCKVISEKGIKVLMMHTFHNQFKSEFHVKRVYSWPQIYYEIKNETLFNQKVKASNSKIGD